MMTTTRVETIPPITRAEVEGLARTEYARVADQLRSLAPEDWSEQTGCPLWDVRAMAGHTTGMLATTPPPLCNPFNCITASSFCFWI